MQKATNVDQYIKSAPKEIQGKLRQIRSIIKKVAPQAQEKLSYGMPYYGYKGRLAYFAYAKNHIGLYLIPPLIEDNQADLQGYETSKSTLRLPNDKELPLKLIERLIKLGVKNNENKKP